MTAEVPLMAVVAQSGADLDRHLVKVQPKNRRGRQLVSCTRGHSGKYCARPSQVLHEGRIVNVVNVATDGEVGMAILRREGPKPTQNGPT
jgi:hypothetical protein